MKTRVLAMIVALGLAIPTAGSATPTRIVVDLPDTPLTSPNVHLVTSIHTGSAVGGKFAEIGGKKYYFQTSVRPAFFVPTGVGTGGVHAFDVTNPEQPVPAGFLPLPLSQNEDVELSANRGLLLYSMDSARVNQNACTAVQDADEPIRTEQNIALACRRRQGALIVVDISNPNALRIRSVLLYPETAGFRADGMPNGGPGHTSSCILDCNYVYAAGARNKGVYVIDLRDPDAPQIIGSFASPAGADGNGYAPGVLHDVNTDRFGNVWMVGSGGTSMYAPIKNPLKPVLVATMPPSYNAKYNGLIHHGSVRLDATTVLIGEEDFATENCGNADGSGPQDGSIQTWRIDTKKKRLTPLAQWDAELRTDYQGLLAETAGIACSSHWFDVNASKVVADAFYEQGVRFLDVSNPKKIRQVGFWIPPAGAAGQAQFVPGRSDLVYVSDYARGLDVLRIDNGGKGAGTVVAPVRKEWLSDTGVRFGPALGPDETFGYACRRPVAE